MPPSHPPRRPQRLLGAALTAATALLLVRCGTAPAGPTPDTVEVCGAHFDVGTRVVSWREPNGYDAYRQGKAFTVEPVPDGRLRYSPLRGSLPESIAARAAEHGLSLADLQQVVCQFVLHYDACGTSRQCFKVLQDVRCLSVHFLLDVDGTIYQTLDLREKAHHATVANDVSIGVEIAHPGLWPQPLNADMRRWYEQDQAGWRLRLPPGVEDGVQTPGFVARPDRPDPIAGVVQGRTWHQFDYTSRQYEALAKLCAGLARIFPRLRLDVPRDADGQVIDRALAPAELQQFEGILGHYHVQSNKYDPGPALQWERLLDASRALLRER